jgi:membrane protease YdiL (CAAX protease family)
VSTILAFVVQFVFGFAVVFTYYMENHEVLNIASQNIEFLKSNITVWYLLFIIVNAFYEELIFRGYLITEIENLKNIQLAALVSVVLEASCHLYQGVYAVGGVALDFLIFTLYYIKSRRIMPIILAHMFIDLIALIRFAKF